MPGAPPALISMAARTPGGALPASAGLCGASSAPRARSCPPGLAAGCGQEQMMLHHHLLRAFGQQTSPRCFGREKCAQRKCVCVSRRIRDLQRDPTAKNTSSDPQDSSLQVCGCWRARARWGIAVLGAGREAFVGSGLNYPEYKIGNSLLRLNEMCHMGLRDPCAKQMRS